MALDRFATLVLTLVVCCGCADRAPADAVPSQPPDNGSAERAAGDGNPPDVHPRYADYERVKARARDWLDRLEVDPPQLRRNGIHGIQKLEEMLECYLLLSQHAASSEERESHLARARHFAAATEAPGYHALEGYSDEDFSAVSLSYLRVAWLMDRFGFDTSDYRRRIEAIQPRLDSHIGRRGVVQRKMLSEHYAYFELEPPPIMRAGPPPGVLASRLPFDQFKPRDVYELTHEIYLAFEFGHRRTQDHLTESDLGYIRRVIPPLTVYWHRREFPDLLAELLSCMTYLAGRKEAPAREAVDYLLDAQNPDGTWGDYESLRPKYGEYLDQQMYLHTVTVVLRALIEVFEGDWPVAGERQPRPGGTRPSESSGGPASRHLGSARPPSLRRWSNSSGARPSRACASTGTNALSRKTSSIASASPCGPKTTRRPPGRRARAMLS